MPKPEVERKVIIFLKKIPRGKVATYKSIGERFNLHPRVVGLIMSRNKHPELFPCFKVINSNGELGGYSGVGGLRKKAELLRKDGVKFEKRINLRKYLWS
ncbi:MAG: MGMT family protein [Candidatus Micrarchaeota archaeon]|nr:MGMT family protein [Candidatus Micrarchaeota archaeon]